jgi:mannose-6-phosphate isomerase-like protein (cupin superfamily)
VAEAVLIEPDAGEVVADTETRHVRLLSDGDEATVTLSWYAPGQTGPGPHVHHRHVDAFYVLEGSLTYAVGPQAATEIVAGPGTFVAVPPDVIHTFWNAGPDDARFVNVHAPGCDFAEYMRASRDGREPAVPFDQHEPPEDGGLPAADVVVRGPGEGEALEMVAASALLKAQTPDTRERFTLAETTLEPGFEGPRLHRHERLVDTFYVLEGTLTVRLGDETHEAPAGSFVLVPPATAHTFSNPGAERVRLLNLTAPAGFERYLKEMARLSANGSPEPARLEELAARYDFHAV